MARLPKYTSSKKLKRAITKYFTDCDNTKRPYTITGLALDLGFLSRESLLRYGKKDEFYSIIKQAKLRIQRSYNEALATRRSGVAGLIFILKNNFGWKDRQEFTGADGQPITINLVKFSDIKAKTKP